MRTLFGVSLPQRSNCRRIKISSQFPVLSRPVRDYIIVLFSFGVASSDRKSGHSDESSPEMLTGLSLLLLLPLVVYRLTKQSHPERTWAATGLSFGLIIAPASLGLYSVFFLGPYGLVPGMLGLVSLFVHEPPGFEAITALGLRAPQKIVNAQQCVAMEFINGLCWATVYGTLGYGIDFWRSSRRNRQR